MIQPLNQTENTICKKLFGGEIEFVIENSDSLFFEEQIIDSYTEGLKLQKIFNFYDPKSELFALNKKRKLKVTNELLELIKQGIYYSKLTNGEYDISLGKSILARKTKGETISQNTSYKDIKIKSNTVILNSPDILIDLGSIAKGYIIDKMVEVLINQGIESGLINGRGDIRVFGENPQIIGIQHPREKNQIIEKVKLQNNSIATSGDYNQFAESKNKPHIINNKNLISVTVIAPTLTEADAFATMLFVLNKQSRENLLQQNKNIKALIIDTHLNIKYYNGLEVHLYKNEK